MNHNLKLNKFGHKHKCLMMFFTLQIVQLDLLGKNNSEIENIFKKSGKIVLNISKAYSKKKNQLQWLASYGQLPGLGAFSDVSCYCDVMGRQQQQRALKRRTLLILIKHRDALLCQHHLNRYVKSAVPQRVSQHAVELTRCI